MSRTTSDPLDPCLEPASGPGCARPALERLRFWNGRFLVARDLRDQQEDLIRRLEYHQQFAHGEGILCGFQVREHPRKDCRDRWIVIEPGMGYDCCGRTLWSPDREAVEIPPPPKKAEVEPEHEAEAADPDHPEYGAEEPEVPENDRPQPEWFVLACHAECLSDPVPALYSDDLCDPIRHEHGRMRETVAIKAVPAAEVSEECWPRRHGVTLWDCSEPSDDDCHSRPGDAPPCTRSCACGECLVLAAVWRDPRTGHLRWSTEHRKVLAPAGNLTRITGVSWPHGGEISADDLWDAHRGSLIVQFSRRLRPADGMKNGINMMTFTVSFLGPTRGYEQIIPPESGETDGPDTPRLSENQRCAIFDLPRDMLTGRLGFAGTYLHVRLLCDFLVDCHGRSVSGAHLGGDVRRRGSGNHVQGGVFESWFYLRSGRRGDRR